MTVYAIDPGPVDSALVAIDGRGHVRLAVTLPNTDLLGLLAESGTPGWLIIERVRAFGRVLGNEVIETAEWSGRFFQAWVNGDRDWMTRKAVVTELTGGATGGDRAVRQALIERWGGPAAIRRPNGPLAHVRGDCWQALGVAVAWRDMARRAKGA